jgi:hypothetical protein
VTTFQKPGFDNPIGALALGIFLGSLLPGISLIFGPTYSEDTLYVYGFVGGVIVDLIVLIGYMVLILLSRRKGSRRPHIRAHIGFAAGLALGLALVSTIAYVRFIRPVEIQNIAGRVTNIRGKTVAIIGVVSSTGTEKGKATYVVRDDSGTVFVVAKEGAASPQVGHRVWLLGWVGIDSAGDNFLFEHVRRELQ